MKTIERWLVEHFPEQIVSLSQSKRVVIQGGVRINGRTIIDFLEEIDLKKGDIIEIGKHFRKVIE